MKSSLKKLGVLGPSRYRNLLEELRKANARSTKLAQELELARGGSRSIKEKSDGSARALRDSQAETERQTRRAEKLTGELEKVRAEFQRRYERDSRKLAEVDQKRSRSVEDLQERLEKAEQALAVAREMLMAVEVKLDILEGAANVLDIRTRATSTRPVAARSRASM